MSKAEEVEVEVSPTSTEHDIFLRWVAVVKDRENIWDPAKFGRVTSVGKVFGKYARMYHVYCMGNSFADITIHGKEESDVPAVRIHIFYSSLQGIQVYHTFDDLEVQKGTEENPIRPENFQPYQLEKLIGYIEGLVK